jgi:hypothetical protein
MIRGIGFVPILFIMIALTAFHAYAAKDGEGTGVAATTEADLAIAPVEIDGKVLFRVRGATSYPADQRAATIRDKIEKIAADRSFRSDGVQYVATENITTIMAGDIPLMVVSEADAKMERLSRSDLARVHAIRIR